MKLPAELVHRLRPAYAGKRVCVTGGAGFIGGHLVDALVSLGAFVHVLDDLSTSTLDHLGDLIELEPQRLMFVHGSILDDLSVRDAMRDVEIVFHLAAMTSVPTSIENPQRSFAVNATGTVRVLEGCRRYKIRRIVYSGSSSAYGDGATPGQVPGVVTARTESMAPSPLSPYAASKLAGEMAVSSWARSFGLSGVSLRYFNIFGPRQAFDSPYAAVISSFISRMLAGVPPIIYGDGAQSRDFTPVANAVSANLLAGASTKELNGQVVNIGTGRRTDLIDIARMIAQRLGCPQLTPEFRPPRVADVRHSMADIAAAKALLGYDPVGSLDDAMDETVAWYKQQYMNTGP